VNDKGISQQVFHPVLPGGSFFKLFHILMRGSFSNRGVHGRGHGDTQKPSTIQTLLLVAAPLWQGNNRPVKVRPK
jgi:hypothetical protein